MFKSRMWGIGWDPTEKLPREVKHRLTRTKTARSFADRVCKTGLRSVPGRTARLKTIYLLQIAAEIEHALMVQYLYAAYALDETFAEGRDDAALATITRWKRDIRTVARQEMAHLITVQNLLLALGAEVYLSRENNFLDHPDEYPFPVCFEQLSLRSLAKYVATESPEPDEVSSVRDRKVLLGVLGRVKADLKMKISRVGVVYLTLYWLFLRKDSSAGPWDLPPSLAPCMERAGLKGVHVRDTDFVTINEFEEYAAVPEEWGVYESDMKVSATDPRSRALWAIHWIMAQGEGPVGLEAEKHPEVDRSHFKKFLTIFEEFEKESARFERAVLGVPLNPVVGDRRRTGLPHGSRSYITQPEAKLWAQLFNLRYQMLLIDILLALSTSRHKETALRQQIVEWAVVREMEFLRVIGQLLPTMHRHAGSKTRAAAPFETIDIPADLAKRWDLQRVLMKRSNDIVRSIAKTVGHRSIPRDLLQRMAQFDKERLPLVNKMSKVQRRFHWHAGRVTHDRRAAS
jgi:Ferritin-like